MRRWKPPSGEGRVWSVTVLRRRVRALAAVSPAGWANGGVLVVKGEEEEMVVAGMVARVAMRLKMAARVSVPALVCHDCGGWKWAAVSHGPWASMVRVARPWWWV